MTDLSKSASPSEPRPEKFWDEWSDKNRDFRERKEPDEWIDVAWKFAEDYATLKAAEPQRDERETFYALLNHNGIMPDSEAEEIAKFVWRSAVNWAARASAAPLKQTAEIRNQILEEAALETLSFLEEVPAEKWPPYGLCPERNRAGDSAETARNIAGAIRKLKSVASLPQPSAGPPKVEYCFECGEPLEAVMDKGVRWLHCMNPGCEFGPKLPKSIAPSAGQPEGK